MRTIICHLCSGVLSKFLTPFSTLRLFDYARTQRRPHKIRHRCICTSTCLHRTFHLSNLKHLSSCARCAPSQAMSGKGNILRKAKDVTTVDPKETAKIAVAASAASTSPPTDVRSKPSTTVGQTPKKRTKGKNSRRPAHHLVYTLLFITAT